MPCKVQLHHQHHHHNYFFVIFSIIAVLTCSYIIHSSHNYQSSVNCFKGKKQFFEWGNKIIAMNLILFIIWHTLEFCSYYVYLTGLLILMNCVTFYRLLSLRCDIHVYMSSESEYCATLRVLYHSAKKWVRYTSNNFYC